MKYMVLKLFEAGLRSSVSTIIVSKDAVVRFLRICYGVLACVKKERHGKIQVSRNPSLAPLPLLSTVCSIFSDGQGQEDVPVRGTLGRKGRAPRLTINLALLYPDVV